VHDRGAVRAERPQTVLHDVLGGRLLPPRRAPSPERAKNAVSVAPGNSARTRTPRGRYSAQRASLNESTNAFEAP